jgi:pyridoxal 5'-phosphate synthase pdxT subunit
LDDLDGIILPGGESTAMGLIGTSTVAMSSNGRETDKKKKNMWECLQDFALQKPVWGTCAGMILLSNQCIGTSAVIQNGQALIGGINICVVRNYFGSQVSSFEMPVPAPPSLLQSQCNNNSNEPKESFPGVFIRAPAILTAGDDVEILGKVIATPCRQAAITLHELDRKIANGENVIQMGVVDALEREDAILRYKSTTGTTDSTTDNTDAISKIEQPIDNGQSKQIVLPGAADGTNAREVICAVRKGNLLCTAFHPELTNDYRWHEYFVQMVQQSEVGQK